MIEFFIGIILGVIFFGGLYLTVSKLGEIKNPGILIGFSFIFRMGVLLGGLYFVSKNGYEGVLFAMFGIILFKFILIFAVKNPQKKSTKMR